MSSATLPTHPLSIVSNTSRLHTARVDLMCSTLKLDTYETLTYYIKNCDFNSTMKDSMLAIINDDKTSSKNDKPNYILIPLLVIYISLMVFGACGSGLVIFVVARNRAMRTPRNVFIVNLAISDLTLCLFTQPFNLLRLLGGNQMWVLGSFMCKFSAMFQGTNIFVSTISITAIALDRFQVIVYPTRTGMKSMGTIIALISIWIISFIMASPLVVFSKVSMSMEKNLPQCSEIVKEDYIIHAKIAYSIASMLIQYVVPLLIVSIAYTGICLRIKYRMVNNARGRAAAGQQPAAALVTPASTYSQRKQAAEAQRQRRTNILLASIAIIFALSWLPLNISNIVMDFKARSFKAKEVWKTAVPTTINDSSSRVIGVQGVFLIQATCLCLVLSSACSNPVLYGWLNENFRREFKRFFVCRPQQAEAGGNLQYAATTTIIAPPVNNNKSLAAADNTEEPLLTTVVAVEPTEKEPDIVLDTFGVESPGYDEEITVPFTDKYVYVAGLHSGHNSEPLRLSSV